MTAISGRGASRVCIPSLLAWMAASLACATPAGTPEQTPRSLRIYTAASPSTTERYCAWYGDARDGVLYYGESAFWSTFRKAGGDPEADLAIDGPQQIGRFDLRHERFLPSLDVGLQDSASGVWDVRALPGGPVFFTTFFESMGSVDPASGRMTRFAGAGLGLNELAPGPEGSLLVSRYGSATGGGGSVVVLERDGRIRAEHPLSAPPGERVAPKTLAFDPERRQIWVTTDLFPDTTRHPALVLDLTGRELRRIEEVHVQFVHFEPDGRGFAAFSDPTSRLFLAVFDPGGTRELEAATRILLDPAFPEELDFVQDIQVSSQGQAVLTRWSGRIHVVDPDGSALRSARLPALEPGGLYYTAVLEGDRLCATYCGGVQVVCGPQSGLLR